MKDNNLIFFVFLLLKNKYFWYSLIIIFLCCVLSYFVLYFLKYIVTMVYVVASDFMDIKDNSGFGLFVVVSGFVIIFRAYKDL